MMLEIIRQVLGWSAIINLAILLYWFAMFIFLHDWVYTLHSRWFKLDESRFDAIHYGGMGLFKLATFMFNIVPYLVLSFLTI